MRFFKSDFGNIVFDVYEPLDSNGFVVQIAHGMVEHRGRYKWLCEKLQKEGFKVYINDHRGHGDSIGDEVYLGEMGEDGFEKAVRDMKSLNNIIHQENPDSKIILLGHSMGSLLSRRYLQNEAQSIDMLVLTGTPSPNFMANFGSKLSFFLNKICLNKTFQYIAQKLIYQLSLGGFNVAFRKIEPYSKSHWISSDLNVVREYDRDKKTQFIFSLNSFGTLLQGMSRVFGPYPKPLLNPNIPILFMSGKDDACGNFGKGAEKAYKHLCSQGFLNTELRLYEKCRHEVFNEIAKEEYFKDFLNWFEGNKSLVLKTNDCNN